MITGTNRRLCSACLLAVAAVVTAFLASGCLWGVVRDAQTGAPIAGAEVGFECGCRQPSGWPLCGSGATTDANGIYVIDMLPVAPFCLPNDVDGGGSDIRIEKVGYQRGYYTPVFDYRDNPNASFDDLHSFWEVQDVQLVPGKWAQVELLSFDISHARVTDEAEYLVELALGARSGDRDGYFSSPDPPPIVLEDPLDFTLRADQIEVRVTLNVEVPHSQADLSTAGFSWTVPEGETGWLTATLDSADAAGPDDSDLEFTAQIRYRSVTEDTVLP